MKKVILFFLTAVLCMPCALKQLKAADETDLVIREFNQYKFNLSMTNEYLTKDPNNSRPNVEAVIQQKSYDSLFDGSKSDRNFELLWKSDMDHIVMPKYVTLPLTLHYELKKADILNKIVVCNADKGNGYVDAVKVDVFYEDGTSLSKTIDTMSKEYEFYFDNYNNVVQVDVTILSAVDYYDNPVLDVMTLSEIDMFKVVPEEMSSVDKDELYFYVEDAKKIVRGNYTVLSYKNFRDVLDEAIELLEKDTVSQEEIDQMFNALLNAYNALELKEIEIVDKKTLKNVIEEYHDINQDEYTPGSFSAFYEALEKAKAVDSDPNANQAEVDEMIALLLDAVGLLERAGGQVEESVSKLDLSAKYNQLIDIEQDDYTDESYEVFINALVNAKEILDNENVSQKQVDQALVTLKEAYASLEEKDYLPFTDVLETDWYFDIVSEVYELGLLKGATDSLFKPSAYMNRAMVAVVFYRMEGSPSIEYQSLFTDVNNGEYYSEAITWAKVNNVINGYNNGTYQPLKNITREEMAQMLYNFAIYKGIDVDTEADLSKFLDSDKVSGWHKDAIMWANANGLITGKYNGTKLDPQGNASRAECSKMLLNGYKIIYK